MRVGILGGGALGTLLAGLLAPTREVAVLDRDPEHVDAMREGLRVAGATERTVAVEAATSAADLGAVEALLVCVKSYQTGTALAEAAPLYEDGTAVCTLQNGLGNAEAVAEHVPEERVVAGTTAHGATLEGPGRVRHAGDGPTRVGPYFDSGEDAATAVAEALAPLDPAVVADVRDAIWEKLLVNVGVNAATALARVPNGALTEAPGRRLVEAAVGEAAEVAAAAGRDVPADAAGRALDVAAATATNVSSMRADLEAGRPTEIEALNGAVVARGEAHGVPTPVNRTLADLVRLAENG